MKKWRYLLLAAVVAASSPLLFAADIAYQKDGTIRVHHVKVDDQFKNPTWTPQMEEGFWKRAQPFIQHFKGEKTNSNTGEHEKWTYPKQMLNYLAGNKADAIAAFEAEDIDRADHAHTLGFDWYWSFTIKGQVRKYFLFGPELKPDYRKRMFNSAKIWTEVDPRPNFELILLLDNKDEKLRAAALDMLQRSKKQLEVSMSGEVGDKLREWAKKAPPDRAKAIEVIDGLANKYKSQDFGSDVEKWRSWWADFAQHDWVVLEEAERVMNIRPHPAHDRGQPGAIGLAFNPSLRGYWVDGRNTDNLRAMRETSVYLMAEETGNELTRQIYKEKIKRFVHASYTIGMGEWDSENYLSHTTMPYHNLYDFAKDPEVKMLAKAFLDWVYSANAVKYYRGGFGGPTKRDYGGANRVFGSEPGVLMWLWAGDCPLTPEGDREDLVHAITSAYRPPAAVVALARKGFKKPVELLNTKPTYSNWFPGADAAPEFFETMFYGDSYYLGTVASKGGASDVGAFKLLAYNSKRGVDFVLANSGGKINSKNSRDQIGQYRNLCVFLNGAGKPFMFQIPNSAKQSKDGDIWFIELEKTYLAIRPLNLADASKGGGGGKGGPPKDDAYYNAKATDGKFTGFAMEIGDSATHKSMDAFKAAVKTKGKLDSSKLAEGKIVLTGTDGRVLDYAYNAQNDLPTLVRDGTPRDWIREFDMYKPSEGESPIKLGWKEGALRVEAGGHIFQQTVTADGKVITAGK